MDNGTVFEKKDIFKKTGDKNSMMTK